MTRRRSAVGFSARHVAEAKRALARTRPFDEWVQARPRSPLEIQIYHYTTDVLRMIAGQSSQSPLGEVK